jgi:hypothetical protein
MIIRIERSGGFAGINEDSQVNSDDLPASMKTTLTKLINVKRPNRLKSVPKGSADHYSYRITVDDGTKKQVIDCSEYDIQDDLMSLVTFVHKHRRKRK